MYLPIAGAAVALLRRPPLGPTTCPPWPGSRFRDNGHFNFLGNARFHAWLPTPPEQPERSHSCVC
jgi:hypothetical protein